MFSMREKQHRTKQAALKAAVKLRPNAADRMVRACVECPRSAPSRRRNRWASIAARLADAFKLDAVAVRRELDAARREPGEGEAA